jgi:hypothetical protein
MTAGGVDMFLVADKWCIGFGRVTGDDIWEDRVVPPPSFPRRRESIFCRDIAKGWIPAFAGMTTDGVDMFLVADKLKKSRIISRSAGGMALRPVGCLTEPGIVG